MAGERVNRFKWPDVSLAFVVMAGGVIFQSGILSNRVTHLEDQQKDDKAELKAELIKVRADNSLLQDKLYDMDKRGASNAMKLDFLVSNAKGK